MTASLVRFFPLWALACSALAYLWPAPFAAARPAIVPLLGLVMFGMGMTLKTADFTRVMRRPGLLSLGLALQYGIMPLAAWAIALALKLPPELLVGLVLVGACPGGTASNVVCYLARGDLALSITLTTVSTLAAVALTPALTWLYAGQWVPVPVLDMLESVLRIVFFPVLAGVLLNHFIGDRLKGMTDWFPALSVAAILAIIAIIVALNRDNLATMGLMAAVAVIAHNLTGLGAGYALPRLLGADKRICRTLAIEVGMQNSGLGVALAVKYFSPAAALPGALFSIWHNLSGSLLASWWARHGKG